MYTVKEHPNPKYFISWGKGLQSTALCLMSCLGDVQRVDAIVTAETGWEHPHIYVTEEYYTKLFENYGIPVYKTQGGDIKQDSIMGYPNIPFFTSKSGAPLRRQCTAEYKIHPIRKQIRKLCGLREDNTGRTLKNTARLMLGISYDELERVKPSNRAWIENLFPLVDLKITRNDCEEYLKEKNLPVPLKSACVVCPYKNAQFWKLTKENYPEEFLAACEFDKKIRTPPKRMTERGYDLKLYLHKSLKPLEEIEFDDGKDDFCDEGYCFI